MRTSRFSARNNHLTPIVVKRGKCRVTQRTIETCYEMKSTSEPRYGFMCACFTTPSQKKTIQDQHVVSLLSVKAYC